MPLLLLALLVGCSDPPEQPVQPPPDLVLVVVDTLRADGLSLYGNPRPTTPEIDRLGTEGAWFHRAYAHSGWTLASFASLFSGQLPHVHRVGRSGFDPTAYGRLPDETVTLAERLRARGYKTGAWMNNTFLAPEFGLQQGFDVYDWKGADNVNLRSADDTVAAASAWLATQSAPVFLVIHLMEPHYNYQAPAGILGTYASQVDLAGEAQPAMNEVDFAAWHAGKSPPSAAVARYVRARYDEEVRTADRALGGLFATLRSRPGWDNTLVAVTADHGEELWDHGGFEHGHSLLGELTRVPLVLGGGRAPKVGRIDTVVGHADLTAALLLAAGAAPVDGSPGQDLLALARQGTISGRMAISENTLYGPPRVSIVGDRHRLDVDQATVWARVIPVEPDGSEQGPAPQADQATYGEPLMAALVALRGGLDPVSAVEGPTISSGDIFRQLEALGYLDAR